jgi:UTP--glucose-1-phosphate uridylyltransferase
MAKDSVGPEPFGVMLGDDLVDHPERPCLSQLIEAQERFGGSVLAVMRVPREQVSRYGVVTLEPGGPAAPGLYRMRDVVEKPHPDEAPSDLAVIGRYALSPNIFPALEVTPAGVGGEIQLTDAIRLLMRQEPVYALEYSGVRYDTGDPVGLLTTSLAYALKRPDLAPGVKAFLRTLQLD